MPAALKTWTVLPHRPLARLGSSVMTVTGDLAMPLTRLERRMTVIRLRDGRLVIYSAIALDEPQMRVLESWGRPSFLIVPSHLHRNDAFIWKARYPELVVAAPPGARAKVEDVVRVDTTTPDFGDERVRFVEVAGTAGLEGALEVRGDGGLTLVLNDVVGNLPPSDGWVLRALGFATARPRVPRAIRRVLVKDARALREQLEAWSGEDVERVLVSHGGPIDAHAADALREIARTL